MLNEEIARIFERMARVLAFKGKDRFRIMAYERAASAPSICGSPSGLMSCWGESGGSLAPRRRANQTQSEPLRLEPAPVQHIIDSSRID